MVGLANLDASGVRLSSCEPGSGTHAGPKGTPLLRRLCAGEGPGVRPSLLLAPDAALGGQDKAPQSLDEAGALGGAQAAQGSRILLDDCAPHLAVPVPAQ